LRRRPRQSRVLSTSRKVTDVPKLPFTASILVVALLAGGLVASSASASRKPTATERAAIAQLMKAPRRCVLIRVATVRRGWASARFQIPATSQCSKYIADGVAILHRRDDVWHMRFSGSAWSCPIPHVPEAVRKDLRLGCPEGGP
jgi:hypothetical protein